MRNFFPSRSVFVVFATKPSRITTRRSARSEHPARWAVSLSPAWIRRLISPFSFATSFTSDIAALKVEREAMVRRLADVQKVQDDGEPLTYYVGTLSVPGEDRPYTVVVTQLIDMGNPDAAVATAKV